MDFDTNLDQTGQHYMIDKSITQFIVDSAELKKTDIVLEIGYGHGALTKELAKKCKVIAVDIEKYPLEIKNVTFIHGNILENFNKLKSKYKFNKIVANIPYNISEPLMKIMFKSDLDSCIFTIGKNFTEILTRDDNRIGILANYLYHTRILKLVNPRAFSPRPRTESAVVSIKPRALDEIGVFYKKLIMLDDKKLKNAFERVITDQTKREIKELTKNNLFNKKLYELSNEESIKLNMLVNEWIG